MKRKLALIFFLFHLWSFSQDQGFFRQIWLDQGLSQSSITTITQDQQGFMWFGTQDGLNRFDGRRIETFNYEPFSNVSVSGDDIMAILPVEKEKLWILSGNGVDELDTKTSLAKRMYPTRSQTNSGKYKSVLNGWYVNKRIYLFCRQGFYEVNKQADSLRWKRIRFKRAAGAEKRSFEVVSICADAQGTLYFASSEGIFHGGVNDTLLTPLFPPENKSATEPVTSLVVEGDELIWSKGNEINFFHRKTKAFSVWKVEGGKEAEANTLLLDYKKKLWIGTTGSGLWVLEKKSAYWSEGKINLYKHFVRNNIQSYGLNCDFISHLFQSPDPANEDRVWIGSRDAGIFQFSYSANSFNLISANARIPGANFFSVACDSSGNLWSGTHSGILRLNRSTGDYAFYNLSGLMKETSRAVEAVHTDSSGRLWIGIGNRLYQMNTKSGNLQQIEEEIVEGKRSVILRIGSLTRNELLIGTDRSLIFYNVQTRARRVITEINVQGKDYLLPGIAAFYADKSGNLWLATHSGVFMLSKDGKSNRCFRNDPSDKNSLLSNVVLHLCPGNNGELLVASSKGLSILEKATDKSFTNYHSVSGLANNFIYGVLKGEAQDYWMSTNYGLSVFNMEKRSFRTYTAADGTYINEFNSGGFLRAEDGELFFGGLGGLVSLRPSEMEGSKTPPLVVFVGATIGDTTVSSQQALYGLSNCLSSGTDNLKFQFSILDFSGPSHAVLMYRLGGADAGLHELKGDGLLQISFANLAPGNYTLEVFALSAEGVSSIDIFKFPFSIATPFWNSWWFYAGVILLAALTFFFVYRLRLRNKLERVAQLERVRQEENERVRKIAALDLHDEFGNGLTRISMLVETARMKLPAEHTEVKDILQHISDNSLRLYQGTKDFIWSIHPGNDNLYETVIRIKDFADEIFFGSGTDFKLEGLQDFMKEMKHPPGTGRNLVMIFKEGLSNIVKHAGAGQVWLRVEKKGGLLTIVLADNGRGFDSTKSEEKKQGGFGLGNMRQRAQKCGAHIEIKSGNGQGTQLELKIKTEFN